MLQGGVPAGGSCGGSLGVYRGQTTGVDPRKPVQGKALGDPSAPLSQRVDRRSGLVMSCGRGTTRLDGVVAPSGKSLQGSAR
jgi:hypothetical protein